MAATAPSTQKKLDHQRWQLLRQLEAWLEKPMIVLAFVWLALFIVEVVWDLDPALQALGTAIWIIFGVDFVARFIIAPKKLDYLKSEWLTGISLVLPALRVFRIFGLVRVASVASAGGGLRLLRVVSSFNRGMRALGKSMGRRGLGYVVGLSAIVLVAGAAGMYAFENHPDGKGLNSYPTALYWTAMLMTTIGSEFWPATPAGRALCIAISIFSLGVFGYLTAALATFFVGRDAQDDDAEIVGVKQVEELKKEIAQLRDEIRELSRALSSRPQTRSTKKEEF